MVPIGDDWFGPGRPAREEAALEVRVVLWVPVRCPACRSADCPVTASPKAHHPGIRYHRCASCSWTFKSMEYPDQERPQGASR